MPFSVAEKDIRKCWLLYGALVINPAFSSLCRRSVFKVL